MRSKTGIIIVGVLLVACVAAMWFWRDRDAAGADVRVAILQYVEHPALNEAREAFEVRLREEVKRSGRELRLHYGNAQGDSVLMVNMLASINPGDFDVIVTFATPFSQAAKQRFGEKGTPLVYAVITDPVSAGLVDSMERPGDNNTASSDQWPYRRQMELIREFMGDKNRVGCLLNPGEANTQYAMKRTREAAAELKIQLVEQPVSGLNDVPQAIAALQGKVDAVYIPADNTAMAAAPVIIRQAHEAGIPVFAGDPGTFKAGAVAGLGVSYKDVGIETANSVVRIVIEKAKAGQIPVAISKTPELMVHQEVAKKLGLTIPDAVLRRLEGHLEGGDALR